MSSTPPRRDRVNCRQCGFELGDITSSKPRWIGRAPGVTMFIDLLAGRADLVCPRCGTCRTLIGDKIRGVVLQALDDALDCRECMGGKGTAGSQG